jgi:membrane protein DedA with SNARE-associated domain
MPLRPLIHFLALYKYQAIFPIAVLEGPIITIISGFLISRNILAFVPAFIIVFLGDAISDSFFYFLGRGGRSFLYTLPSFMRISDERLNRMERQYERSPWKTMIIAKVSYGLGMVFMTASGIAKMSYKRFFYFMAILNALRSLVLLGIGYYFGRLALRYGPKYITYYAIGMCVLVPIIYIVVKKVRKQKPPVQEVVQRKQQ